MTEKSKVGTPPAPEPKRRFRLLEWFDGIAIEVFMFAWIGAFFLAVSGIGAYLWARAFEIVMGVLF